MRILIPLLMLALVACGPSRVNTVPPATYSLEVQVANDRHEPVAAARVWIVDGVNAGISATTGPDGTVKLHGLKHASQTICAGAEQHHDGCEPLPYTQLAVGNITIRVTSKVQLPTTDPLEVRTDFLTLHCDGKIVYPGPYPAYPEAKRKRILECLRENGYTDLWFDVLLGKQAGNFLPDVRAYDYLDRPAAVRPFLEEVRAAGIRVVPVFGLEDNADARRKYPPGVFARKVEEFVKANRELLSLNVIGVEVREWASWDEVLDIAKGICRVTDMPVAIHQNQRKWGPDRSDPWRTGRAEEMAWWKALKERCPRNKLALAFQGSHARVEDSGGGFLSPREEFLRDIRGFLDPSRLGGIGVAVIASEYGHLVSDRYTKSLGEASLKAGAIGFTNGGR